MRSSPNHACYPAEPMLTQSRSSKSKEIGKYTRKPFFAVPCIFVDRVLPVA
jgi:hypothetical protein